MAASTLLGFGLQTLDLGWLADNIMAVLAALLVISIALSFWLYNSSFSGKQKLLAEGGSTGQLLPDFKAMQLCSPAGTGHKGVSSGAGHEALQSFMKKISLGSSLSVKVNGQTRLNPFVTEESHE